MLELASGHPSEAHFSDFWAMLGAKLASTCGHVGVQDGLVGDILATSTWPMHVNV